jgi:ADP-heptose:LPS heptosyltransferase
VDEIVRIKPTLKTIPSFSEPFDAALDLQGLLKSALCIARAKADRKVGYHWRREGAWFFSERVIPDPTSFHVVDQYVDVAREVGGQMDRAEFMLKPNPEDVIAVRQMLSDSGVSGTFVAINAGAGWVTKRWVPAYFAQVVDSLASAGVASVLVGGKAPADISAANEVLAECKSKPISLLGQTSVRELVALVDLSAAHLGGDTGTTHLAAALNKPAVGLYSITKPLRTCPYGQIDRCCYEPSGLGEIKPEAVLVHLKEALG